MRQSPDCEQKLELHL